MSSLFAASSAFASTVAQKHPAQFAGRTVRFGHEEDKDEQETDMIGKAATVGALTIAAISSAIKGLHPKNFMGDTKQALKDKKIEQPYLLIVGTGIGKVTKGISKAVAFPFKKAAETQPVVKLKNQLKDWGNKINPFKPALEEDALEEAAEKALDLAA